MQAVVEVATKLGFTPAAATLQYLIQPKKFDRVFHIIFDPEFEVDQEKTNKTTNGQLKLKQLIDSRKLLRRVRNGGAFPLTQVVEYVDVDKTPDDVTMETFFVVAETHSPKLKLTSDLIEKIPDSLLKAFGSPTLSKNPSANNNSIPLPFKVDTLLNK